MENMEQKRATYWNSSTRTKLVKSYNKHLSCILQRRLVHSVKRQFDREERRHSDRVKSSPTVARQTAGGAYCLLSDDCED